MLKSGGPHLFTDTKVVSLYAKKKAAIFILLISTLNTTYCMGPILSSHFHFFFSSLLCFSFYTRHPLEWYKPSVVCKTPLSYCFSFIPFNVFLFISCWYQHICCQKQSLVDTNIFILNIWSRNFADNRQREHLWEADNF